MRRANAVPRRACSPPPPCSGGCQTAFDLVGVATPLTAGESRQYNGSYQGRVRQISATGPGCPTENAERVIMVGDGVLWYAYTPGGALHLAGRL